MLAGGKQQNNENVKKVPGMIICRRRDKIKKPQMEH